MPLWIRHMEYVIQGCNLCVCVSAFVLGAACVLIYLHNVRRAHLPFLTYCWLPSFLSYAFPGHVPWPLSTTPPLSRHFQISVHTLVYQRTYLWHFHPFINFSPKWNSGVPIIQINCFSAYLYCIFKLIFIFSVKFWVH